MSKRKGKKRILSLLLCAVLLCGFMPQSFAVAAEPEPNLTITKDENLISAEDNFSDGAWNLTEGTYTVSGTAQDFESIKTNDDVTLNLNAAQILHTTTSISQYAPAISVESGTLTLNLSGENTVQGSTGFAGVYVAPNAKLVVSEDSTGSLAAKGGDGNKNAIRNHPKYTEYSSIALYYGGGAGIGGNGVLLHGREERPLQRDHFGTVEINGGTIFATGGKANYTNVGAGAGIGSGGTCSYGNNEDTCEQYFEPAQGTIEINGGFITATGGEGEDYSLTLGGAGIGSGGLGEIYVHPQTNVITTAITGGTVTAEGRADGAGIGGGSCMEAGPITISGGTITATGGYEIEDDKPYAFYGGAGIGGGDARNATTIDISGNATVTAYGGGAAAGIGGGNDGFVGSINDDGYVVNNGYIKIGGQAVVTAYGGSVTYRTYLCGGAGIGAGQSWEYNEVCGTIEVTGNAKVCAYGGNGANAIGVGSWYEEEKGYKDFNSLTIADTVSLWAQTEDETPALLASTDNKPDSIAYKSESNIYLVFSAADNKANGYTELPGGAGKEFNYTLETGALTIDGNKIDAAAPVETVGNWATLYKIPEITVSYQFIGDVPTGAAALESDTITPGAAYTAKQPVAVSGWKFDGWYTDDTWTTKFIDETVLDSDTTLYGRWGKEVTPVTPIAAVYKVEHYIQQDDCSYALQEADTEFPLYGEIGKTVSAEPKSYNRYSVNKTLSKTEGTVIAPTVEDGVLTCLVLQIYYDKTGGLTVSKTVSGGGASSTKAFTFTVTLTNKNNEAVSGTFGDVAFDENGQCSFTLQANQSKTINDIPAGVNYVVEESDNSGYRVTVNDTDADVAQGTIIGHDTVFAAFNNYKSGGGGGTTRYTLTYGSNGGTQYNDERYDRNTVVKLDKVPAREGYQFTGWYADKELTEKINEIKMTGNKTVYAGWQASTIPDQLNGGDHFAYVVGYPDGTVQPSANISRAETVAIFFRLLKEEIRDANLTSLNNYEDVPESAWYIKEVSTMTSLGIVKGRTADIFDPDAPITRAEFAAICARFDTGKAEGDSNFTDISGHWAENDITRAVSLGWVCGYEDGTFRPDRYITRAEAMTIINRVLCRIPENENDLLDGMKVWPDNQPGTWYYLAVQEATNSHEYRHKGEIYETWTALSDPPNWIK